MKLMNEHDAIIKLYNNVVTIRGDVAYDKDGNEVSYDADAVQAEVAANEYKVKRQQDYPSITEQLDKIYHDGIDAWKVVIKATKDKYPKE